MTTCEAGFFNQGDFIPTSNGECVIHTEALRALWIAALIMHSLAILKYLLLGKQLRAKFRILRGELNSSSKMEEHHPQHHHQQQQQGVKASTTSNTFQEGSVVPFQSSTAHRSLTTVNNNNTTNTGSVTYIHQQQQGQTTTSTAHIKHDNVYKEAVRKKRFSYLLVLGVFVASMITSVSYVIVAALKINDIYYRNVGTDVLTSVIFTVGTTAYFVDEIIALMFFIRMQMKNAKILDPSWAHRLRFAKTKIVPVLVVSLILVDVAVGIFFINPASTTLAEAAVALYFLNITLSIILAAGAVDRLILMPLSRDLEKGIQSNAAQTDANIIARTKQMKTMKFRTDFFRKNVFVLILTNVPFAFLCAFLPQLRIRAAYVIVIENMSLAVVLSVVTHFLSL